MKTTFVLAFAASKSVPIFVNALVSEAAAKTFSSVGAAADEVVLELLEHAAATRTSATPTAPTAFLIRCPSRAS